MIRTSASRVGDLLLEPPPIFGFIPSSATLEQTVSAITDSVRTPQDGVALVVTPNIDHIFQLDHKPAFRTAYDNAAMILCDGFPVYYYALARGHDVHHVTGCDVTSKLLRSVAGGSPHRLFFVVDSTITEVAVHEWATSNNLLLQVETLVPPYGFGNNRAWCSEATNRMRDFGATILIMGVGASQSEIFVDQHRAELPPCWAICVGQAVKVELRLVNRAPKMIRQMHAEWLWRLLQEPGRLVPRYTLNSIAFIPSVLVDIWKTRK